jgi:hypothetical protein
MKTKYKLSCLTYLSGLIRLVGFLGWRNVHGVVLGWQVRSEVGLGLHWCNSWANIGPRYYCTGNNQL